MQYVDVVLAAEFGCLLLKERIEDLGRKCLGIRHRTSVHISAICSKYSVLLKKTIDELDSVQFVLQDNKIPVYSYMGRYFAAIGQGRSLVQGQIAINFISERCLSGWSFRYRARLYCWRTHRHPASGELLTRSPAPTEAKKPHARAQAAVTVWKVEQRGHDCQMDGERAGGMIVQGIELVIKDGRSEIVLSLPGAPIGQ